MDKKYWKAEVGKLYLHKFSEISNSYEFVVSFDLNMYILTNKLYNSINSIDESQLESLLPYWKSLKSTMRDKYNKFRMKL